jgi:glycosyltransferase involved in cell wall biosynthesis
LERGHTIDFFAKEDFVRPEELFGWDTFTYVGVERPAYLRLEEWTRRAPLPHPIAHATGLFSYQAHLQALRRTLIRRHHRTPYDVVLFLGTGAQFDLPDTAPPVVSWLQGPPTTEIESIRKHRDQIVTLCGPLTYAKLRAFYLWKHRQSRREITRSNVVICGSPWSRDRIIEYGVAPEQVYALPYPFDLTFFSPASYAAPTPPYTFLWLGRIVPRKRLDLLLDAFALLAAKRSDVHLQIAGHLDHFEGYRALLDAFPYPDQLSYVSHVPRSEVPELLGMSTALVQPSENENFGSSVAEALAVGTPVILGPTNGTGAYATDACFSFDQYTPDAVCAALEQCLTAQISTPRTLKRQARQTAEAVFSTDSVVDQLEHILLDTAAQQAATSSGDGLPRTAAAPPIKVKE